MLISMNTRAVDTCLQTRQVFMLRIK